MSKKIEASSAFKILAVGDGAVGKTCFLVCYAENRFPTEYVPTVFENYHATCLHEKEYVQLSIWDTAGQEDLGRLRRLSYPDTDMFMICYSIVNPTSLENVKNYWRNDVREHGPPESKLVLIGLKLDLREDGKTIRDLKREDLAPVRREEGEKVAKEIGAKAYYETSACTFKGVKEAFDGVIHILLNENVDLINNNNKNEKKVKKTKRVGLFMSSSSKQDVDDDVMNFVGGKN